MKTKSVSFFLLTYLPALFNIIPPVTNNDDNDKGAQRYFMNSRLVNWGDAFKQCRHLGQTLLTLRDEDSSTRFQKWLREKDDNASIYWIGGIYAGSKQCDFENSVKACWKWVDSNLSQTKSIDPEKIRLDFVGAVHGSLASRAILIRNDHSGSYIGSAESTYTFKFICEKDFTQLPLPF